MKANRIYLREALRSDSPFFIEIMNTKGWLEHIGNRNIKTDADAFAYIQKSLLDSYARNGFGLYIMCLNETDEAIGICGIVKRDTLELPDLGFAILPKYEGHGYVFEACELTLKFAENELGMKEMLAITNLTNSRSQNLLERLGFRVVSNNDYESEGEKLKKYSLILTKH